MQVRVLTDSVSGEGIIPVSSHGGRGEGALLYKRGMAPLYKRGMVLFIGMLIHFTQAPPS